MIAEGLSEAGYAGGLFYKPTGKHVKRPLVGQIDVSLIGYVADNHSLYQVPNKLCLRSSRRSSSVQLITVDVALDGRIYPFFMPLDVAIRIPDYSVVEIRGKWRKRKRRWLLLCSSVRVLERGSRAGVLRKCLSNHGVCYACGLVLESQILWGLNEVGEGECVECGAMRGRLSRNVFLGRIEDIASKIGLPRRLGGVHAEQVGTATKKHGQ